eukprot:scpid62423/ scgid26455/ 
MAFSAAQRDSIAEIVAASVAAALGNSPPAGHHAADSETGANGSLAVAACNRSHDGSPAQIAHLSAEKQPPAGGPPQSLPPQRTAGPSQHAGLAIVFLARFLAAV